jgi:predicted membrane protein
LGAGESRLNVADLVLTALSIELGAGDSLVDLFADREDDLEVSIQGGVGRLTVMLPDDVGARVQVAGGLGSVNASGLQVEGDAYVNDAYGRSEATIRIDIDGGIGEVDLELVR